MRERSLASFFNILLVEGGIERHIRIATIVVSEGEHDIAPDLGRLLLKNDCRIGGHRDP